MDGSDEYPEGEMDESLTANQSLNNSKLGYGTRSYSGSIFHRKLCTYYHQISSKLNIKYIMKIEDGIEKFDDLYIMVLTKDNVWIHYHIQCKHKMDVTSRNITYKMLCSLSPGEPFSLLQYFISYKNFIKKNKDDTTERILIICTNNDFKEGGSDFSEEIEFEDGLLNKIEGARFRKILSKQKSALVKALENASDVTRLAKALYEKNSLDLKSEILRNCHIPICKKVIEYDQKSKKYIFRSSFLHETKDEAIVAFKKEYERISPSDEKRYTKQFTISENFGKQPELFAKELQSTATNDDDKNLLGNFFTKILGPNPATIEETEKEKYYQYYDALVKENCIDEDGEVVYTTNLKRYIEIADDDDGEEIECPNLATITKVQKTLALKVANDFKIIIYRCNITDINLKFNTENFRGREDKQSFIKNYLFGYILVKSEKPEHLRFNLTFPEEKLPRFAKIFIEELWSSLENKYRIQLKNFRFVVAKEKAKACPEAEEICSKTSLPNDIIDYTQIEDFLNHLVFVVNLPNEEKMMELIKKNIFNVSNFSENEINKDQQDLMNGVAQMKMEDFMKNSKSDPITQDVNYIKEAGEKVCNIMSCISHIEYTRHFTKLKLHFKTEGLTEITNFHSDKTKKILIIKTTDKDLLLTKAKVYQVNKEIPWPLEVLLQLKKDGVCLQNLFIKSSVIVVCNNTYCDEHAQSVVESFAKELIEYLGAGIKLILITCNNNSFVNFFKEIPSIEIKDKTTLKDLSKPFLRSLLGKEIKFQGQDTCLESVLITEETLENGDPDDLLNKLEKLMEPEALIELIVNENISVGDSFNNKNSLSNDFYSCDKLTIRKFATKEYVEDIENTNKDPVWIIA